MKKLFLVLCGLLMACTRQSPAPTQTPDASVAAAPVAVAPKEAPARPAAEAPTAPPLEAGAARCSASALSPEPKPAQPALPAKVEAMRRRIIAAAVACDYAALKALSVEVDKEFRFTFEEGQTDLVGFWREREQKGDGVMARLVRVLNLPYSAEGEHYLWPSAASVFRNDKDWAAIEGLYPPEAIAQWKGTERGYTGLRTGIHVNGDWLFAVSGGE